MKSKKILSLMMSLCILGTSTTLFAVNTKAAASDTAATTVTTDKAKTISVSPMIAGIVTITSTSGANVRSGPGTNYSIIGTANYGAELTYAGVTQNGWYKVAYGGGYGWVSSTVARLG